MNKPEELTEEQWVNYTGHIAFAVERMNKCLDLIADANFLAGEQVERERIIKLLETEAKGFSFIGNFYAEAITSELISKLKSEQK